jgi:integral membrane protein
MLTSIIGRLRITGFMEGSSFLLLLLVGMPLKYLFGFPYMVQVVGMAHGLLFIVFIMLSTHATIYYRWPVKRMFILWISSVLPFGTFYADYKILRDTGTEKLSETRIKV